MKIDSRIQKLSLLTTAILAFSMAYTGPSAILTPFAVSLGASESLAGLVFGIIFLLQAVMITVFGIGADRYGKRLPLLIGSILVALGTFLCPFAADTTQLILCRIIVGVGSGALGLFGVGFAMLFPKERTSVGMGLYMFLMGIGGFAGAIGAGIIAELSGYNMVFYILGFAGLIAAVTAPFGTKDLPRIKSKSMEQPKGRGILAIAKIRNVWVICIANLLLTVGLMTATAFSPLMALNLGAPAAILGLLVGLIILPQSIMSMPIGFLAVRIGNKKPAVLGCLLNAISLCLVVYAYAIGSVPLLMVSMFLCGATMGMVPTPALAMVTNAVNPEEHGTVMGLIMASAILPGSLTVLTGYLVQVWGYPTTFLSMAILAFAAALFMTMTKETRKPINQEKMIPQKSLAH